MPYPLTLLPVRKAQQRGFTLLEMAVVLMIVGLLLGGLIPTMSAQMESQRINETRKTMSDIKEALIGYTVINGRLPWPACGTIQAGQANAGIGLTPASAAAVSCTSDHMVLPWATLGTSETDGWGNRFTYRVTTEFADAINANTYGYDVAFDCVSTHICTPPSNPQFASFALCSCGTLDVKSAASAGTNVATNIPAIIISHGKNGAGAYTRQGIHLPGSSGADELENSDSDTIYVSHTTTSNFDDLVEWVTLNILYNRMVAAGKLP